MTELTAIKRGVKTRALRARPLGPRRDRVDVLVAAIVATVVLACGRPTGVAPLAARTEPLIAELTLTTTADFALGGNLEGGVDITNGQLTRGRFAGAVGAWQPTLALPEERWGHTSVAYNGYLYVIGGRSGALTARKDVWFASIDGAGRVAGPWAKATDELFPSWRNGHASVAYNGYLYVVGGYSGVFHNDVLVAPIHANGTIGAWTTSTTTFDNPRLYHTSVAYNGYLYVIGGYSGTSGTLADVQVAPIHADGTVGEWTPASAVDFSEPREEHKSVAYNGYLYVLGGYSTAAGVLADVQFAPIYADGTVGPWDTTGELPIARQEHTAVAYHGSLYVVGGFNGDTLDDIQVAPINANGTLGAWTPNPTPLGPPRDRHSSVAYNGYLYVIGGTSPLPTAGGEYRKDVQVAPIGNNTTTYGGVGDWAPTNAFDLPRSAHTSVAYDGYLYVFGGANSLLVNDVEVARINADGTVGAWAVKPLTTNEPTPRFRATSVAYNGYLYVIGGYHGGLLNDVWMARINTDGMVGSWTRNLTTFDNPRFGHTSVAYNGYLYVIGGCTGGLPRCIPPLLLDDVRVARINADGTVGDWAGSARFPVARERHTSVAYNGHLYVIGGDSGTYQNDVQVAAIDPDDGSVGTWQPSTTFTTGRYGHTSVAYNGYLYVIGGNDSGAAGRSDVWMAPINGGGMVGDWTGNLTTFDTPRYGHTSVAYNGYLYVIGGYSGTYHNDVQVAPIEGPIARGFYSRLIDIGSVVRSVDSVTVDGSANHGTVSLEYRVASENGILGPTLGKGVIPLGSAVPLGSTGVRYVWLRLLLDDTGSVTSDLTANNERDVTEIRLTYTDLCRDVTCTADACHFAGVCDPGTGLCSNPPKGEGTSCGDGAACNGAGECVAIDAGVDASLDAGRDADDDAADDAEPDAAGDAEPDAGHDASDDAGPDAADDAGGDAGDDAEPDAGHDAADDAGDDASDGAAALECTQDVDCYDHDPCTVERCSANKCVHKEGNACADPGPADSSCACTAAGARSSRSGWFYWLVALVVLGRRRLGRFLACFSMARGMRALW